MHYRYRLEKNALQSQMDAETRAEKELSRSLDEKGRLIIEMRTSLQQINELLSCVGELSLSCWTKYVELLTLHISFLNLSVQYLHVGITQEQTFVVK